MNKTYIDLAVLAIEKSDASIEKRLDADVHLRLKDALVRISKMLYLANDIKTSTKNDTKLLQDCLQYVIDVTRPQCQLKYPSNIFPLEDMMRTLRSSDFDYEDMKSRILALDVEDYLKENKNFLFEFEPVTLHYLTSTMRTLDGLYLEAKLKNQPFNCFMVWDKKEDLYTLYNTEQEVNDFIKKELTKEYTGVDKTIFANRFYATHYADTETLEMSGMSLMLLESLGYEKTFRELDYLEFGKPNPFEYMLYVAEYTTNVQLELHVSVELEKKPFKG